MIRLRRVVGSFFILLVFGCATAPVPDSASVLHDEFFVPAPAKFDPQSLFQVSDAMRRYLSVDIASNLAEKGPMRGLYEALYSDRELKLEYDTVKTRTASETFLARSGNCLSLVIMTAAFAKELGLKVYFQGVATEENWLRRDNFYFLAGHVNVTIGRVRNMVLAGNGAGKFLTIDFEPLVADVAQRTWQIKESTIVAMYMNNRAAETLAEGNIKAAYWWAREAVVYDVNFVPAQINLAVIYRRAGHAELARATLESVLSRDPDNVPALSNLIPLLSELNRTEELALATERLKRLREYEPYHFFKLGVAALRAKNYALARDMFKKETRAQPNNSEFQFNLALAYAGLGDRETAKQHLAIAVESSSTLKEQGIYAAKLSRLQAAKPN